MAEDIVDEQVELRLIDTRQLVAEAKKLKEAKKLADQAKKVKTQLTFGQAPFLARDETIPKSQQKAQTRVGAIKGQNTFSAFLDMQKKLKESEQKIKKLESVQKKIKKLTDEVKDKLLDKMNFAGDILQSGGSPAVLLGSTLGRFGPIGLMVASIVLPLFGLFSKEFERGGLFSTKLRKTEQDKNIVDIEYVIDVRSGTKFITDDLRISQVAPEHSNTQNLKYEHIRYVSQELGV